MFDEAGGRSLLYRRRRSSAQRLQVAVLSYPYWQSQYGGSQSVLGQSLKIGP
jgi:hypothetical protein